MHTEYNTNKNMQPVQKGQACNENCNQCKHTQNATSADRPKRQIMMGGRTDAGQGASDKACEIWHVTDVLGWVQKHHEWKLAMGNRAAVMFIATCLANDLTGAVSSSLSTAQRCSTLVSAYEICVRSLRLQSEGTEHVVKLIVLSLFA